MIEELLGQTTLAQFLEQHYLKLPFAKKGGLTREIVAFDSEAAARTICRPAADLIISKEGARDDVPRPTTVADVRALLDRGCSLGVRRAHDVDPALAALAAEFQADFRAPIDVHLYVTPAAQAGFSWHYDAEEVFVLQLAGSKEWELRKNTVNPWPLVETLPDDMRYEREIMPLMRCSLSAGDWLYIPNGYWHRTRAGEESISLSVGVLAPAAIGAFDQLRKELLDSLRWRQRLPHLPSKASAAERTQHAAALGALFAELGEDLSRRFKDPRFLELILRQQNLPRG